VNPKAEITIVAYAVPVNPKAEITIVAKSANTIGFMYD